jgi:hypothetical protein
MCGKRLSGGSMIFGMGISLVRKKLKKGCPNGLDNKLDSICLE